ncbi:MAG: class I SAM-dependent methyltransferase [Deltaproteobacteria bacterium]|nr:class I SAM-dependent methyltransferase [Deltaproteobacteria bacterium]
MWQRLYKSAIIRGIENTKTQEELRDYILTHGCYSREEKLEIYEKWFANAPRYSFRAVDRKYGITKRLLCDIGCAYGMNLIYCALPGSYGIEIEDYEVRFARSLGVTVHKRDILTDDISDLPKVDVVWCCAVLEHVASPHILLRKMHILLSADGLLALYVPTIPLFPALRYLPRVGGYVSGHRATDHVNAFVPSTLRCFCERAGFNTIEISPFYPRFLRLFNRVPGANRLVDGCVYIGRKIQDWEYPEKATRRTALTKNGFVSIGQKFNY